MDTLLQNIPWKPPLIWVGAVLLLSAFLSGCEKKTEPVFQGYAEGEFVLVAAPLAGRLEKLAVARGAQVQAGDLLFVLERSAEQAAVAEAEQQLTGTENRLADLEKGERPSELKAIRSQIDQARAAVELSRREFDRRKSLYTDRVISGEELDRARTALARNEAALAELSARLQTAQLGGRSDAVNAARSEVAAAQSRLEKARWSLEQKSQSAGEAALVFDTLFEPGEFVAAGTPVVSLLPPENIKIRFFVAEPAVATLRIGQPLSISFDGIDRPLAAAIDYISPQVEYTPPVIYSLETRSKLVFMVEARPGKEAARLHPGQPLSVRLGDAPHE